MVDGPWSWSYEWALPWEVWNHEVGQRDKRLKRRSSRLASERDAEARSGVAAVDSSACAAYYDELVVKIRSRQRVCVSLGVVLVSALLAPMLSLAVQTTASASDAEYDCTSPHCYSVGDAENDYAGIEGQWLDTNLAMPADETDVGGHLTNEMWLNTSSTQWVEEGLDQACDAFVPTGDTCSEEGGVQAYLQFWADASSSGDFYFHLIDTLTPDGDNHVYEIWDGSNGGNNDYQVYLDYNQVGTSTVQNSSSGISLQAGMELYSPPGVNSDEHSPDFDNYIQTYINSRGTWADVDFNPDTVHDLPSGDNNLAMNPCDEFPHGSCLYWSRAADNEWIDGKPS